ncbi:hypothetical protein NM3042_1119 [Neisseria meningitidis NM3042]|nr:hypothetical protein NM3042_1970 [Neisseria meningitidis NM3042]EOC64276.1 hypothetical protein NM3042_1119 [Neisseria meningitidis NM3042]
MWFTVWVTFCFRLKSVRPHISDNRLKFGNIHIRTRPLARHALQHRAIGTVVQAQLLLGNFNFCNQRPAHLKPIKHNILTN